MRNEETEDEDSGLGAGLTRKAERVGISFYPSRVNEPWRAGWEMSVGKQFRRE
jgi:hypothetical protein